jgi:hypothetical protein
MLGVGRLGSVTCSGDRATYLHIAAGGVFTSVREFVRNSEDANDAMRWFIKRKIGIAQIEKRQIFARSANFRVECLKFGHNREVNVVSNSHPHQMSFLASYGSVSARICVDISGHKLFTVVLSRR